LIACWRLRRATSTEPALVGAATKNGRAGFSSFSLKALFHRG
jgi:hypothetical protein